MADPGQQNDQYGKNADATKGGGASTDRGGRDAGMPGPATGEGEGRTDSTDREASSTRWRKPGPTG